jgi:hypothetical protein
MDACLLRRIFIAAAVVLILAAPALAAGKGHVAVFYLLPDGAEDDDEMVEVIADFSYYMGAIEEWLHSKGITRSFHGTAPFEVTLGSGKRLEFSKEVEVAGLGFVLIRPDGTYEVLEGVYTGVGFVHTAKEFFGIK